MASTAVDQDRGSIGARPPVSAHPAFPAIVALWFAALLGLGTLIVPAQLVERLVGATGIASLLPAAAPPLDFTARAAIALAAAILGAMLGAFGAKGLAAREGGSPVRTIGDTAHPPLYSGYDDDDAPGGMACDDKANVITASGDEEALDLSDAEIMEAPDLVSDESSESSVAAGPAQELAEQSEVAADELEAEMAEMTSEPVETEGPPSMTVAKNEPLTFSPPSLARAARESAPAGVPPPTETAEPPAAPQPAQDESAPGLVQLVQQLERTLEKHRKWNARRAQEAVSVPPSARPATPIPQQFHAAEPDEAAQAIAAYFSPSQTTPPTAAENEIDGQDHPAGEDEDAAPDAAAPAPHNRDDRTAAPAPRRTASNDDNVRTLRDAVLNLQRMGN